MVGAAARLSILLALSSFAAAARADRIVVEGEHLASIRLHGVPEEVSPGDYENDGFAQRVKREGATMRVDVAVDLEPLESRAPFPPKEEALPVEAWEALLPTADAPIDDPAILDLAVDILADANTQYEAVTRVIDWIATHVEYVVDPALPTSAAETLSKRKAYCVGMANLAVSLLRTAGIAARDVHGILLQRKEAMSGKPVEVTSAELHRWIEVYMPGTGWVYSDPLRTSHFVDALHVVLYPHLPRCPYDPALFKGAKVELLEQADASYGVDRASDTARQVLVRPNMEGRYSAAVVGVASEEGGNSVERGIAVLLGGGLTRKKPLGRGGKFSFTGVAPGVYELRVYAESFAPSEIGFRIGSREIKRFAVTLRRP